MQEAALCFEVHGADNKYFNLVSDECVSVNSHYVAVDRFVNIIDEIGIRTVDNAGACSNIRVSLAGCATTINGMPVTSRVSFNGVRVYPAGLGSRVRISVPNCNPQFSLVMWVHCQVRENGPT